jgi:hypothetical protein
MGNTKTEEQKANILSHFGIQSTIQGSMVSSWSCSPNGVIRVTEIFTLLFFHTFKGYVPTITVP